MKKTFFSKSKQTNVIYIIGGLISDVFFGQFKNAFTDVIASLGFIVLICGIIGLVKILLSSKK